MPARHVVAYASR
jgi:hypothetical protein